MNEVTRRKYLLFGLLAASSLVADFVSKAWVRDQIRPLGGRGLSVIGDELVFVYAENPGIAFSQLRNLPGGRFLLSFVAMGALWLLWRYLKRIEATQRVLIASLGLIAGGAAGNLIDRLLHGHVTDFVRVDFGFWPLDPWALFNVADAALVVGGVLLLIDSNGRARHARRAHLAA